MSGFVAKLEVAYLTHRYNARRFYVPLQFSIQRRQGHKATCLGRGGAMEFFFKVLVAMFRAKESIAIGSRTIGRFPATSHCAPSTDSFLHGRLNHNSPKILCP